MKAKVLDGFLNLAARLGMRADNINNDAAYVFDMLTHNRAQLEAMYRGSWIVGAAVDCVAEDMTRAGIQIRGDDASPERVEQMQAALTRMGIWSSILDLIRWGRLYGGAIAFIVVDGQDASTPIDYDTIGKDQFTGLRVFDRWQLAPSLNNLVEGGRDEGLPEWYNVVGTNLRIHHSRAIRAIGIPLPYQQALVEEQWGESVIERIHDRLVAFDSATAGAMNLIHKSHLRTVGIENLREVLAAGGQAQENLVTTFHLMRYLQSSEGITLLDKNDTFQTHDYSFSGVSDIILQFGQQISGALGIPLVRLFGQSPVGFNSTGESDIRMYYDNIATQQESRLREGLDRVLRVLHRSLFGEGVSESFDFDFTPLWQMNTREKAEISGMIVDTIIKAHDAGMIDMSTAMRELRASAEDTGIFTNLSDEAIKEADEDPPEPQVEKTLSPPKPAGLLEHEEQDGGVPV